MTIDQLEEWKSISGYEGLYEISDQGNIRSFVKKFKVDRVYMKQSRHVQGYCLIGLFKDGKRKTHRVSRLVMETFKGLDDRHVNHINNIKDDNRLVNLEYISNRENTNHFLNMNKSKGRGYSKYYNKYRVRIKIDGKSYIIGSFKTENEAHQAYINKVKELGESSYA